ncbi:hypothetical protein BDP81DRAFT_157131 [Colletotrichum phormii]|uniref:Uncharacterized protein n=1 Tax=Colletotrichum phormii TaxID=359342 RepID=A0AAJ0A065_9PEZI|nr:uncharacterized protein BDP81DRAFT_157131 [Colletotrichum phormii]KAK1640019.1 hypothetical protein BDP81DRAFT_157131 [Colletotrichum phormii]
MTRGNRPTCIVVNGAREARVWLQNLLVAGEGSNAANQRFALEVMGNCRLRAVGRRGGPGGAPAKDPLMLPRVFRMCSAKYPEPVLLSITKRGSKWKTCIVESGLIPLSGRSVLDVSQGESRIVILPCFGANAATPLIVPLLIESFSATSSRLHPVTFHFLIRSSARYSHIAPKICSSIGPQVS